MPLISTLHADLNVTIYFREYHSQLQTMSGVAAVEERESMESMLKKLTGEWKERVAASVEASRAQDNLNLHKQRISRLVEELSIAEAWEGELQAKKRRVEESLKPPLLVLHEKLEREEHVDEELLQEAFSTGGEEVFKILEGRVGRTKQMERVALIRLVDLLPRLNKMLEEEDISEGRVERMKKMAKVVFQELARPDINWSTLDTWEAEVVKKISQELGGVPTFMARVINQLLGRVTKKRRLDVGVQTEEDCGLNGLL